MGKDKVTPIKCTDIKFLSAAKYRPVLPDKFEHENMLIFLISSRIVQLLLLPANSTAHFVNTSRLFEPGTGENLSSAVYTLLNLRCLSSVLST